MREDRLAKLFNWYGGLANMRFEHMLERETPATALRDLEDIMVFLVRHGRFSPEWVDQLEVSEALRYMQRVSEWIKRENSPRPDAAAQ